MPRYPQELLDSIKRDISCQSLLESHGHDLKQQGASRLRCCCPFHDDKTPSFDVDTKTNRAKCWGACDEGWDVIALKMKLDGLSFVHAVEQLREGVLIISGAESVESEQVQSQPMDIVKKSTITALPCPLSVDADYARTLMEVVEYYHSRLLVGSTTWAYLESRGLADVEMVRRFCIGAADRTLGMRMPKKNRQDGKVMRGRLQEMGLYSQKGHEAYSGCFVLPVFGDAGRVCELYGRRITAKNKMRAGVSSHWYLKKETRGDLRGVWNRSDLCTDGVAILCESACDALTFWTHGFHNVTFAYGKNGFSAEHLAAFQAAKVTTVVIAYDSDAAGDTAALALAGELAAYGMRVQRVSFLGGVDGVGAVSAKDANAYALAAGDDAQAALADVLVRAELLRGNNNKSTNKTALQSATPTTAPATTNKSTDVTIKKGDGDVYFLGIASRSYRVRALAKNTAPEILKIQLRIACGDESHVDDFNMYADRARSHFIKRAAQECGLHDDVVKNDLKKVVGCLEELQDQLQRSAQDEKAQNAVHAGIDPTLNSDIHAAALTALRSDNLLDVVADDLTACGLLGETVNKKVAYLCAASRLFDKPLALVVQSSSAGGKSTLIDAVLRMMPPESLRHFTAVSENALYYAGAELKHKIISIAESAGAEKASYIVKLLQSEGKASKFIAAKDPETGIMESKEYVVEGPIAFMMTTTALQLDDELLNRCFVVGVDESAEQTAAIHEAQRSAQTIERLRRKKEIGRVVEKHRCMQRLLKPYAVMNPYAPQLRFISDQPRTRRDHQKYLDLIRVVCLVHQQQRHVEIYVDPVDGEETEYINVTLADIRQANALAADVLGRSLDELPAATRGFLLALDAMVGALAAQRQCPREAVEWTAKTVRAHQSMGHTQIREHLRVLRDMEFVIGIRDPRSQLWTYVLHYHYEGDRIKNADRVVLNLVNPDDLHDPEAENNTYGGATTDKLIAKTDKNERKRYENGPKTVGKRFDQNSENSIEHRVKHEKPLFFDISLKKGTPFCVGACIVPYMQMVAKNPQLRAPLAAARPAESQPELKSQAVA